MSQPKRVVLKCREQYAQDGQAVIKEFLNSQNFGSYEELISLNNLFVHFVFDPRSPSGIFLVLDVHCNEFPDVDPSTLDLQVFKVSKPNSFMFRDLGEAACKQAQPRSVEIGWGRNKPISRKN
ncbi:hypothetical protein BU24DRAFT_337671 [Aaosphaeria arxii CBS 175.79]|uniref:Uncharacterized protein n=1 Tax=Aaosphaeria arxii CBS 175.79 TaxID=1450172 RepID=A0A6A5Y8F4_9PLEO|nr:uncharacterized protein BU24DRAFT_337671 [Aaosphaeria arxii CBS 175.79]KAF2021872.1 hypothetical protein BU24DRAFT_337671 [Aaosphaeria arxii CBS 175.79]